MKKMKMKKKTEHETEDHHEQHESENEHENENENEHDFPERRARMTTCAVLGRLATYLYYTSDEFFGMQANNNCNYFIRKPTKGDPNMKYPPLYLPNPEQPSTQPNPEHYTLTLR